LDGEDLFNRSLQAVTFACGKPLHPGQSAIAEVEDPPPRSLGNRNPLIDEKVLQARRLRLPQGLKTVPGLTMA
jgi:hypothetical protein